MKRLVVLFWLCFPGMSWGAITFDAQSDSSLADGVSFSWTHTVGGGCTNNIVVVSVGHYNANFTSLSSVTIDGVAATSITTLGQPAYNLAMFRRTGVGTGSKSIAITFSGNNGFAIGTARSYCAAAPIIVGTPTADSNDGTVPEPAINVSSATGELVIDSALIISTPSTATVGAGQTERTSLYDEPFQAIFRLVESDQAGAASVTMSWGLEAAHPWIAIGVSLRESAATTARKRIMVIQ